MFDQYDAVNSIESIKRNCKLIFQMLNWDMKNIEYNFKMP